MKQNNKTEQKVYALKILDYLIDTDAHHPNAVHSMLEQRTVEGHIPAFFFRHSIIDSDKMEIDFSGGYLFQHTYAPQSHIELMHLDYILANALYQDGKLMFRQTREKIAAELKEGFEGYFEGFMQMRTRITHNGTVADFSLFDSYKEQEWGVEIVFSRSLMVLYAFDYLLPYSRYRKIFEILRVHDKKRHLKVGFNIHRLLRNLIVKPQRIKKSIPVREHFLDRGGIVLSVVDVVEFRNLLKQRDILTPLAEAGLLYSVEVQAFTYGDRYRPPVHPVVYIDNIDGLEEKAIEEREYHQATSPQTAVPQTDKANKDDGVLCFEDLEINDKFENLLKANRIEESMSLPLFEKFKIVYQDIQNKRPAERKYKDPYRCFNFFLSKEQEAKAVANSGRAENITYDDKMQKITDSYKISEEEAEVEFEKFRQYHINVGNERKNWAASWHTWLGNREKYSEQSDTRDVKVRLENNYQIAKLVDGGIRRMLTKAGIDSMSVIHGKVVLSDVSVIKIPIPPSMGGKGEETLFEFADPDIQQKAVEAILKNPLTDFKRTEKTETSIEVIAPTNEN